MANKLLRPNWICIIEEFFCVLTDDDKRDAGEKCFSAYIFFFFDSLFTYISYSPMHTIRSAPLSTRKYVAWSRLKSQNEIIIAREMRLSSQNQISQIDASMR